MAAERGLRRAARSILGLLRPSHPAGAGPSRPAGAGPSRPAGAGRTAPPPRPAVPDVEYRPHADDAADPGEIVWAWVPYDEDDGRGKDRPVLVIGRRGPMLLGLMLSSQDHDRDAADEARHGRIWTDIGTGSWDARRRPSEVRLDRLLELAPGDVRREGAALDRARFDRVVAEARRVQGW
ncbi:type II toxin-antitoxin system PemK/MazF family toxin [Blastococcus sp. TML/M2B]|nr:type II toxin-antitoxin system PemK/MazF family toxin [Blastococcus sp. TML/M2B]MBN1095062.1 type II toxin-antitoxin system PemK/MazF family toxin [Blastococcus sp. TML/C7B]